MTYTKLDILVVMCCLVAIFSSVINIATGGSRGNGLYLSVFAILMFILIIAVTLVREQKATK
jgi:uncharacterized membrane protein